MNYENEIQSAESEWEPEHGFFWQIREGTFDPAAFGRALKKIAAISIPEDGDVPRRLVSLLWFIPIFMEWQKPRLQEVGADLPAYENARSSMTNELERILGVP